MAPITVEATTTIRAPVGTVWAFVSRPERYPEWSVVTERMTAVEEGSAGEGTTYREYGGPGPFKGESEWVVTAFEPRRRQVHEGDDGTVRTVLTMEVEPVDGGEATQLHQTIELTFPRGLNLVGRLLGRLFLRRVAASALRETVENAKRIVESERAATA